VGYVGFACTTIAFIAGIAQVIAKMFHPNIPHGVTTIIVLILFLGGVQLLSLSLSGEYISKIFEETKKRPKYIRRSIRRGNKKYSTTNEMSSFISRQKFSSKE
jgi:dolichol-phosphate mannosyltransferase